MIDNFRASSKSKIHLTIQIKLVPSKFNEEKQLMHSKSDNVKKHSDMKLEATAKRRSFLVSEPNYHPTKTLLRNNTGV